MAVHKCSVFLKLTHNHKSLMPLPQPMWLLRIFSVATISKHGRTFLFVHDTLADYPFCRHHHVIHTLLVPPKNAPISITQTPELETYCNITQSDNLTGSFIVAANRHICPQQRCLDQAWLSYTACGYPTS